MTPTILPPPLNKFQERLSGASRMQENLLAAWAPPRVLFDKIASVQFIWKIYLSSSIGNGHPREPALCQLYRHTVVPYITESLSGWGIIGGAYSTATAP